MLHSIERLECSTQHETDVAMVFFSRQCWMDNIFFQHALMLQTLIFYVAYLSCSMLQTLILDVAWTV